MKSGAFDSRRDFSAFLRRKAEVHSYPDFFAAGNRRNDSVDSTRTFVSLGASLKAVLLLGMEMTQGLSFRSDLKGRVFTRNKYDTRFVISNRIYPCEKSLMKLTAGPSRIRMIGKKPQG
jgi:hypothetical protein